MKIHDRIWIVGSGDAGFGLTHKEDCTVYLLDGKSECAMIDAGCGMESRLILEEVEKAGFCLKNITKIFLTHGHEDHSGGAWELKAACGAEAYAMRRTAGFVSVGDEKALSIDFVHAVKGYESTHPYHSCQVEPLEDGQSIQVGDLEIKAVLSEGHCAGHGCFLTELGGKRALFSGDSVFYGGKISIQPIWDCDIQQYIKTCRKIAGIHPDLFLPSHGAFSLSRGYAHLDKAIKVIDGLGIPKNIIGE